MLNSRKKDNGTVGLDIGKYSIKVVSLLKESNKKTLTAYNVKKVPAGKSIQEQEALIKEALSEIDLHPRDVNLSISGLDVIVRFINFPKMTREQLDNALVFEAEKHIPFNVNDVILDSIILGDLPDTGQMRVLLAAAKKEMVNSKVKLIESLNMSVNVMDIDIFAVFNAFTAGNKLQPDKANAFLDIGHTQTDLLIAIGENPYFMRQIQIGGKDITSAIAKQLAVPVEKAEEYKHGIGLDKKEVIEAVDSSIAKVFDDMVKEIHLSFNYFESNCNLEVDEIFCSGGAISQPRAMEYFSKQLGTPVKKWNPIDEIGIAETLSKTDIDSVASSLAVSVGLALRD
ncbi:MAG: type IV pilus assembly protein PilM [Candidatus Omnitrophica bacterium]|nr:type IV pilus assembly protein PilM [Candidatus Omnitrophota bacterium]